MNSEVVLSDLNGYYHSNENIYDAVEKSETKKGNKTNVLKVLVIVLAVLIAIEAIVYAVLMPCLAPVKVSYTGLESFTPQQVNNYLQVTSKTTWINFDAAKAAGRLSSNVIIENVEIEKKFPDKVSINIVERKAAAVTLANVNGKTVPVQIDRNGVIFAVNRGMPEENVPLVTGFTFDSISEGMRLSSKLRPLMDRIAGIYEKNPAYFTDLSEIRVVAKEYGTFELELFPVNSHVKVLVDRTLNEETLQYMMVMLDVLNQMPTEVSVVDLRYGSVSYR
ncbi:MAG: FtsQ-type POTRA domain-containing protein [Treponemataceae bacterium]|nr:FtsQ-type POTRA domain-containing protein [Treponemataceae bacterium]